MKLAESGISFKILQILFETSGSGFQLAKCSIFSKGRRLERFGCFNG